MPNCPEIIKINHDKGFVDGHMQTNEFTLDMNNNGSPPDRFEWDWGDESRNTITTGPSATHTFVRPVLHDTPATVTVKASGPGNCETTKVVSPLLNSPHSPPPPLPHMCILDDYLISETETTITFDFDVRTYSRPLYPNYEWDWGDGSTKTRTSAPTSTHTFNKPVGQDQDLIIIVSGWDANWECDTYSKFPFTLKAIECPTIDIINQTETGRTLFTQEKQFSLELTTNGITPSEYEWDWGDGNDITKTTVPQATHVYQRPIGSDKIFQVEVAANGLGNCDPTQTTDVKVDGTCPELININRNSGPADTTDTTYTVNVTAIFKEDFNAESVTWDWGDGTQGPATDLATSHTYDRPAGDSEARTITATANGPNGCTSVITTQVSVPGVCPAISNIEVSYAEIEQSIQSVSFQVEVSPASIQPTAFRWDFGDGSPPTETNTATTSHSYNRPPGDEETYTVTVTSSGPDECGDEQTVAVSIKGVCPELKLSHVLGEEKGILQTVTFTVEVEGPKPGQFIWDWGDGSPAETLTSLTASHDFKRMHGDATSTYTITVNASGPDSCITTVGKTIDLLPISCPTISGLSHEEKLSGLDVQATFTIEVSGEGAPTVYEWNWGDGSPKLKTTELSLTHVYLRPGGNSKKYQVTVTAIGPGSCESSKETEIEVPGICPRLTGLQYVLAEPEGKKQKVDFTAFVEMGEPDSYTWHWGDGSEPETTKEPTNSHSYSREVGEDGKFEARVIANGPDDCSADGNVTVIIEDIPCPELTGMTVDIIEKRADSISVNAKATVKNGTPTKYVWSWGDGTTSETKVPNAGYAYDRGDKVLTCPVSVTAFGPESCESTAKSQVTIPAKEVVVVPLLCRLMNWIVAYLVAVTAGILVVCYVDEVCDATADSGLLVLTAIMVILSIASIALWYMYRKGACPPKTCDWYAVGWSSLFTMTAVGFYTFHHCGGNSWIAAVIFFLIGGLFGYLWFTKCETKSRTMVFLLYVAIFVVASLISIFAVADSFLS